jgi:hypothetical protein
MDMRETDLVTERISLSDICPRPGCGQRLSKTIREHAVVRTCLVDGYEAVDVDGDSKLAFYEAIGRFTITRSRPW